MGINQKLINQLFNLSDLPLTQLSHTFAQASIWYEEGMKDQIATFDLVVRDMPKHRNYLVAGGLEEVIGYLLKYKYSDEDIKYLLDGGLITKNFVKYLKQLRFTGDVYAMPEGTILFPGEPIIRITAPLIQAALIEIFLLTVGVSNIIFLSKAARLRSASPNNVPSLGMQRAYSFESGMKALRSGYICGSKMNVWSSFVKKFGLKQSDYIINGQHLFIKSFNNELTAFRKMAKYFPDNTSVMIDTYDFDQGLANAITVAKELKQQGYNLEYVTIDSGNLEKLSKQVRKELDQNGLKKVKIITATNLDEYKVKKLVQNRAPIDIFVVATEYVTMADSSKLEVVYKMAELKDGKNIQYTAKLSPGKESYPGRKQVFRKYRNGKIVEDIIGLENEKLGAPLLKQYMSKGRIIRKIPDIKEIRKYFDKQFATIPQRLLSIDKDIEFKVKVSREIKKIFNQIKKEHK